MLERSVNVPSNNKAIGSRIIPPTVNCHAVKTRRETGLSHRLTNTVPKPIVAAPAIAAIIPILSRRAAGFNTNKPTPIKPAMAATTDSLEGF